MKPFLYIFFLFIWIIPGCSKKATVESNGGETQNINIPVRVYNYHFTYATGLSSSFTRNDINSYFDKVNQIWKQAGIQFTILSFDTVNINDTVFSNTNYENYSNREFRIILEDLSETHINTKSMTNEGVWTLVLIKKFAHPAGGVWSNRTETVFFAQNKNEIPVVKNILAHEFGHSLSLQHVNPNQYPTNLMKSGDNNPSTAVSLLDYQIETARQQALIYLTD